MIPSKTCYCYCYWWWLEELEERKKKKQRGGNPYRPDVGGQYEPTLSPSPATTAHSAPPQWTIAWGDQHRRHRVGVIQFSANPHPACSATSQHCMCSSCKCTWCSMFRWSEHPCALHAVLKDLFSGPHCSPQQLHHASSPNFGSESNWANSRRSRACWHWYIEYLIPPVWQLGLWSLWWNHYLHNLHCLGMKNLTFLCICPCWFHCKFCSFAKPNMQNMKIY